MIYFCLILIFSIIIHPNYGKLPSDIKPCKAGDTNCVLEAINKAIETKYKGDPSINLLSIDPMFVKELAIRQPKNSPVGIDMIIKNGNVHGYKNLRAYKVSGFGPNPEGKHEIYLNASTPISLVGDYKIDGKVIILPIRGEGRTNLTLDNIFFKVMIDAGSIKKDDSTFLDVKDVKLNLNATKLHLELSNLFNGDKELGDNLNKFLNENWHDIYLELRPAVLKGFGITFKEVLGKFFASNPYNELFDIEKR